MTLNRFMLLRFSAADKFAFEQRPLPTTASQQHCKSAALDRRENTKLKSILRRIWNRLNRYFRSKRQTLKRWKNFKSILLSRKMQVSWQRGDSSDLFPFFRPGPLWRRTHSSKFHGSGASLRNFCLLCLWPGPLQRCPF